MALLELVMIVKDGGKDFRAMLQDVKPYIDKWTILDTGSKDQTVATINAVLADKPGSLHQEPFIDFATSRNRALDLASGECVFQVILDDSYVFEEGKRFREVLRKNASTKKFDAFNVYIGGKDQEYYSIRVIRSRVGLRYEGEIHEQIVVSGEKVGIIDSAIIDRSSAYMMARTRRRSSSDKSQMMRYLETNPENRLMRMHLIRLLMAECTDSKTRSELRTYIDMTLSEDERDCYELECMLAKVHCDCLDDGKSWTRKAYLDLCKIDSRHPHDVRVQYWLCLACREAGTEKQAFKHIVNCMACSQTAVVGSYIKPTLLQVDIPYQVADLALKTGNTAIGERTIKTHYRSNNDNRLFNMILSSTDFAQPAGERLGASTVVFHATGNVKGWAPGKYKTSGKTSGSGSEIMVSEMAKALSQKGYRVIVFGAFRGDDYDTEGTYDGVQYIDLGSYIEFLLKYEVDHLIVSRDLNNILYPNNVKSVYLWVHDVLPLSGAGANLDSIQIHPTKFRKCLVLCKWHKNYVVRSTSVPVEKIHITRNAIRTDLICPRDVSLLRPCFMYASSVDRGLEHTIRCFNRIRRDIPEATLDVFCDVSAETVNYKGNTAEILELCKSDSVNVIGRIEHDELIKRLTEYDVWLYVTDFCETYCILAAECQAAGLLCVTTDIGSLAEIIGDRGYVATTVNDEYCIETLARYVVEKIQDAEGVREIRQNAMAWGKSQTFELLAEDWINKVLSGD